MTLDEYYRTLAELHKHGHKVFAIRFIKRTTGEERRMVCRLHVHKGVKGRDPNRKEQDVQNRLITVYEFAGTASGFKCLPADAILEVSPAPAP